MEGGLGFSVLRFWLFFRSVFRFLCQKTSVFRFWGSLRFVDFAFFSIWFSVFVKNTSGFPVLVSDMVFGVSYFVLFGFRFLFDLNSRKSPNLLSGMRDKLTVTIGDHASRMTPENLTSQTKGDHLVSFQRTSRASNGRSNCRLCYVSFYEEGKGGENFQKKNTFRGKMKREERS